MGLRSGATAADTGWTPSAAPMPLPRPSARLRSPGDPTLGLRAEPADPDPRSPAAVVRDLRVVKSGRAVLRSVDCRIERGRLTAVVGPAGAGKTLLLRCLLGTQRPACGEVSVLGRPAGSPDLRGRVVQLTPASLHDDLTVGENLRYFARLLRAPAARRREVVERLGLSAVAGAVVGRLALVAQRRAAVATALLGAPELLLLDDFVTGLDPAHGDALWRDLGTLATDGLTVVVTSPTVAIAGRCARLVVLRDGEVLADDTPAGVRSLAGTGDLDEAVVRLARQRDAIGEHAR